MTQMDWSAVSRIIAAHAQALHLGFVPGTSNWGAMLWHATVHEKQTKMISIFDPLHPHYAVHRAWLSGCFANPNDPPVVENQQDSDTWDIVNVPAWSEHINYRIKTDNVSRTISYPSPLRTVELGQIFWHVSSFKPGPTEDEWRDLSWQRQSFFNGMCFETKDSALKCHIELFGLQDAI